MFVLDGIVIGTIVCLCVNIAKECIKITKAKSTSWKYEIGDIVIYTINNGDVVKVKIVSRRYYADKKVYGKPCYYVKTLNDSSLFLLSEEHIKCTLEQFEI